MSDAGAAVIYEAMAPVARISINRAERMNRLDADIVSGLEAAWRRFADDESCRVALLRGAGDRAFSAGADLKAVPHDLYRAIPGIGVAVDKPVVAAVRGWCVGGGMVLTTMADILLVSEDARFSYPEVKVGFSGGLIAALAARIPHKVAMELLLLGEEIDAARAYEVGYANRVVAGSELDAVAMDWAMRLAANAPLPQRMLKRFVAQTLPMGPTERAGIARAQVEQVNASADWEEGRAAFFAKRPPRFEGT
jgi:enoyl-CoA hydratase/carnithine racemase